MTLCSTSNDELDESSHNAQLNHSALSGQLAVFDTATLYEAAGRRGAMMPGFYPLIGGIRIAGPALTVACPPGDNLMLHAAVASANAGEVIVAQCHDLSFGVWGAVLTTAAAARGVAGLVIDGGIRDIDTIRELRFPVFARATALRGADKKELGCLRVPISCGGLLVWPGDYVVADDSGVVVLKAAAVETILREAQRRSAKEKSMIESLLQGQTTMELLSLESVLSQLLRDNNHSTKDKP